jgi:hypothetical protein
VTASRAARRAGVEKPCSSRGSSSSSSSSSNSGGLHRGWLGAAIDREGGGYEGYEGRVRRSPTPAASAAAAQGLVGFIAGAAYLGFSLHMQVVCSIGSLTTGCTQLLMSQASGRQHNKVLIHISPIAAGSTWPRSVVLKVLTK